MNKFEKKSLSFEENLHGRIKLWESIVNDSNLAEDVKGSFLAVIRGRLAERKLIGESTGDWIYFSISMLLNVVEKAKNKGLSENDIMPVFVNLRDDIWDFYKEINN